MKRSRPILELLAGLSNGHCLKDAPATYVEGFITAANNVYPQNQIENILQNKFFIPNDTNFDLDTYLQSASELSVQNHLSKHNGIKNFKIDKQVNPPKDVDAYYEADNTRVSIEVKCPVEAQISGDSLVLKTAGRVPDHQKTYAELKGLIEGPNSLKTLELAKNKDNTMKDFLLLAQDKFSASSSFDDLNVLLVACGNCANIQEWWHYLYGGEGLFTQESFFPPSQFKLVDVVVLTNLKYLHSIAREHHDWTLQNAFLLPCINRFARQSLVSDSIDLGLSTFNHHLGRFAKYTPDPLSADTPRYVMDQVKINHYVMRHLEKTERDRYFPVMPLSGKMRSSP